MSLFDLLMGGIAEPSTAQQLGRTVGAPPDRVQRLAEVGLPALLAAMQRNASTEEGAASLARALQQHQDDQVDDVRSYLQRADTNDGNKILGHVFGSESQHVQARLAQETGLDEDQVSGVMSRMAPLLLGMLGQQQKEQRLGASGLAGLLSGLLGGQQPQQQQPQSGLEGLLGSLLGGGAPVQQQPQTSGLGDLLGALLGGSAPQPQPQPEPSGLGGLLSALMGGQPQPQPQPAQSGLGGLLSALMGGQPQPQPQPQQQLGGLGGLLSLLLGGGATAPAPQASGIGSLLASLIGARPAQAQQATQLGLLGLLQALQRNSSTRQGALSLKKALAEHQDDPVDDIGQFLARADTVDGGKILQHVFGRDQNRIQTDLARQTGMEPAQASELMARLAPLVLGSLGQVKAQQGLDSDGVAQLLGALSGGVRQARPDLADATTRVLRFDRSQ